MVVSIGCFSMPNLTGIERIDAARPHSGLRSIHVVLAAAAAERRRARGDQQDSILHPLHPRQPRDAGDGRQELAGVEARILGDGLEEPHVGLRVDLVARAGGNQPGRLELARPDRRRVAERAVDRDARTAEEVRFGKPDRQLVAGLPRNPNAA